MRISASTPAAQISNINVGDAYTVQGDSELYMRISNAAGRRACGHDKCADTIYAVKLSNGAVCSGDLTDGLRRTVVDASITF